MFNTEYMLPVKRPLAYSSSTFSPANFSPRLKKGRYQRKLFCGKIPLKKLCNLQDVSAKQKFFIASVVDQFLHYAGSTYAAVMNLKRLSLLTVFSDQPVAHPPCFQYPRPRFSCKSYDQVRQFGQRSQSLRCTTTKQLEKGSRSLKTKACKPRSYASLKLCRPTQ